MRIHPYYFSWQKRALDTAGAISLLLVLAPVYVVIGVTILFSSGRPIIFAQKRLGKNKLPFTMYKFRVMYVGAEKHQWRYRPLSQAPEPMYKNWQDPRFVGIGKWLSKTGLDELPQLWNILRGEMSFVGPRPLPIKEARRLPDDWNFRYQVKPGIFSHWSMDPHPHTSLSAWKKLERETLKQGGMKIDLRLLAQTLLKIWFK